MLLEAFPRQPQQISDMSQVRKMFDGYDAGVLVADEYFSKLIKDLEAFGVLDDTAIMLSFDHGETLGEPNGYGDHQTADQLITRIPMNLKWPGADHLNGKKIDAFHYQIDVSATLLELLRVGFPSPGTDVVLQKVLISGKTRVGSISFCLRERGLVRERCAGTITFLFKHYAMDITSMTTLCCLTCRMIRTSSII